MTTPKSVQAIRDSNVRVKEIADQLYDLTKDKQYQDHSQAATDRLNKGGTLK